jgi:hypothetical protein
MLTIPIDSLFKMVGPVAHLPETTTNSAHMLADHRMETTGNRKIHAFYFHLVTLQTNTGVSLKPVSHGKILYWTVVVMTAISTRRLVA